VLAPRQYDYTQAEQAHKDAERDGERRDQQASFLGARERRDLDVIRLTRIVDEPHGVASLHVMMLVRLCDDFPAIGCREAYERMDSSFLVRGFVVHFNDDARCFAGRIQKPACVLIRIKAGCYETQTQEDGNEVFGFEFRSHLRSDAAAPTQGAGAGLKGQED
jgi:hypothetical protein